MRFPLRLAREERFLEDVFAVDAEVDHAVHDESGNVVVAHAQELNRHVFRSREQTLLVVAHLDAAAFKKLLRVV